MSQGIVHLAWYPESVLHDGRIQQPSLPWCEVKSSALSIVSHHILPVSHQVLSLTLHCQHFPSSTSYCVPLTTPLQCIVLYISQHSCFCVVYYKVDTLLHSCSTSSRLLHPKSWMQLGQHGRQRTQPGRLVSNSHQHR